MSQIGQNLVIAPGGALITLTGDVGGAIAGLAGNINIVGGTNIATVGTPHTITFNLDGTTNHAIQLGNAGGGISSLGVGATGTVLTGVTGNDPAFSATPTVTTMYATTFDTNVAAAACTLSGTAIATDGTDVNIPFSITTKGSGPLNITTPSGGIVFRGLTAGFLNSEWHTIQRAIQTVNAVPTNIFAIPLVNNLMVSVKALINGFQDDYSDCVGGEIMVTAYRAAAGDIILVGAPIINVNYTDLIDTSDIDAQINVGTQSLEIKVIGVAAQNWNWVTTLSYMYTISNI